MTVRVYQSTDVGAPVLSTANDGSLVTILRACLVTGYGSRTPQGWTIPFSDLPNNLACFKSVSGDTIRVNDNIDYRYAEVAGFKTMTDKDTGTEEYPNSVQVGGGNIYYVSKRYDTNARNDGWIVVASDNWFYYYGVVGSGSVDYPSGFFFGQYDCLNPSFTENYMITGQTSSSSYITPTDSWRCLFDTNGNYFSRRNYQNAENPVGIGNYYNNENYENPNPFTGSLELMRMSLANTIAPYVRYGHLPNLYRVRGNSNAGYTGGEKFTINTKNYVVLAYSIHAFVIEYDTHVG